MDIIENGVHKCSEEESYVWPTDPSVLESLEKFRDMKLGFMTHIGLSNQIGIIESWALSDEIERSRWSQWGIDWVDIETFKKQYYGLNKSFNPMRFDPERWANFIARNGFKYSLLPTKHHEGFCLWDTQTTTYKTTDISCPFHAHKHADMFKSLTEELRKHDVAIGAYFSKIDWHDENYWPEDFKQSGATHKYPGYDTEAYPEKWEKFKQFTKTQILEIANNYGPIDIMWLDGAVVGANGKWAIDIDEITNEIRKTNPNLIMVDRMCPGFSENYVTPEQRIPKHFMDIPWESCISLGGGFSYGFGEKYKDAFAVTNTFVEILCKGGNLALNIAPQADGKLAQEAICTIEQFGDWVMENAEAIYDTRPIAPYWQNVCGMVQNKEAKKYLFVTWDKDELTTPKYIYFNIDCNITHAKYKGIDANVKWMGNRYRITIPPKFVDTKLPLCFVFEVEIGGEENEEN